ncbi:GDP-L-fucose synthase [Maricaulis sp.]|uniref:GDP-L-fucose synthase n=1 Tax=Maricaulis sp. TaxID=1486257 RepID=UPI00262E01AE|nr:GDP-L-fucose synthase [Maricaulis sp.]
MYTLEGKRIWVAGHRGMVGSALVRRLHRERPSEILTVSRQELDLTDQASTARWMRDQRPDAVFVPAAKVGGILANDTYPAEFLFENLMIASNIIHASHQVGVEKLLFLGSSCIYPKFAEQPIVEDALLTGALEPTNEWYAIAKIAGIKLCQSYRRQYKADFISAMPTNLYGPGDNYHPTNSHVIPALLRKAHEAKRLGAPSMEIWGTGTPRREFLHVDDCADALVHLMKVYSDAGHVNVGSGEDLPIEELARQVMNVVGFEGELTKDLSKPDGTPRKLMSADKIRALGWQPSIGLRDGLADAYNWFLTHEEAILQES